MFRQVGQAPSDGVYARYRHQSLRGQSFGIPRMMIIRAVTVAMLYRQLIRKSEQARKRPMRRGDVERPTVSGDNPREPDREIPFRYDQSPAFRVVPAIVSRECWF